MLIPWRDISADTLARLVESYVLREGTDYGEQEVSLAEKVAMVMQQLQREQVLILYSELHESVDLITADNYRRLLQTNPDAAD